MNFANIVVFNAASQVSTNSSAIPACQMVAASLQASFSDGAAAGTMKLQASNDHDVSGDMAPFVPTHWSDIPSASIVVAAGAVSLIAKTDIAYQWVRVVWTSTGGAGTMTATLKSNNY